MRFAWLEELLPAAVLTPRSQVAWLLFFALFPLAYLAGIRLETAQERPAMMAGFQDRAASIRSAQKFAESKGYPVTGWRQYVIAKTDDQLLAYYGHAKDPVLEAAKAVCPAQQIEVLFRSPDQTHEFRAYLTLMGRVNGYDFGKSRLHKNENVNIGPGFVTTSSTTKSDDDESSMKNAINTSDQEAVSLARRALAENAELNGLVQLGKPGVSSDEDDSSRHEVAWDATPAGKPDLTFHITVGVRDSQVVSSRIEATAGGKHAVKTPPFRIALITAYTFFLIFASIYAIIRYANRTLQKEVSHVRTLIVAALFATSYSTLVYSVAVDQIATRISGATFSKIGLAVYIAALVSFSVMGLLVGLGYGSGEGEVREAFPGKLTSLDALLAGRLFSLDVGASVLCGAAAAGWLLLFHHAIGHFLTTDVMATRSDVLAYTFARMPWLTLLVGRQYDSMLVAVTGLLLPAAFLMRRSVRKSKRFAWLLVFAVFAVLNDAAKYSTPASALLALVVLVCALLLPFFAFDLLAAIVSLSALSFVEELTRLSAVFPSWHGLATALATVAALTLLAATFLALRGKRVDEDEVRPLYAKNLAQRMSLQAEVQAAREAQLRLLPQSAPVLPGIQFAACCLPARGVGGDFYDFFRLDANRVAIFVAQGGDQGLASALCIALAKGVLMHASLQPNSPTQIVLNLEASLGELLEGGSAGRLSFLYAVVDTRRNLLNYARLGESPRFVPYRAGAVTTPQAQLERVVPLTGRAKNAAAIYEGSAHPIAGDFLIFFTKGVASLKAKRFARREYQWLDVLMPLLGRSEEPLQASLAEALQRHQRRASEDLTAVVLRVGESQTLAQEVVA